MKCQSNLAASSDFVVTSRRIIIYTGQTFPIAIMTVFRTKLYMQHIRSLFWFLLTILSILSLTAFSLISVGSQISVAPLSHKRLTSKCSIYQKPVHYLTVTQIKCIWDKYIHIEAIQTTSSSRIYKANIYHIVIYSYLFSNLKAPPAFKRYPLITPPLKALNFLISLACIDVTSQ